MYIKNLLILLVITWSLFGEKRQFPEPAKNFLVDRQGSKESITMVTRKEYKKQKRYSANGTGKDRIKIVFQNGGNKQHTFDMIESIESMMDSTRPHVLFMCENRMDQSTYSRLTNRHGFNVEEMGPVESRPKERIWAAIKSTVPYTRLRECEERGLAALWLQFGTGASKYVVIGCYREWKRLDENDLSRTAVEQKKRWSRLLNKIRNYMDKNKGVEVHLMGDLNLDTMRWPQLGSQKKGWPYVWFVDQLYEHLINGSGMCLSEVPGVTWVSADGSRESCLDVHLTNRPDKVKSVKILNEFSSDHQTLVLERTDQDIAGNFGCTKRKWSRVPRILPN